MRQECNCPLCGRALQSVLLEAKDRWFGVSGDFDVRECGDCELAVTHPQLRGVALARYYPSSYSAWRRPNQILGAPRRVLSRIRSMLPPFGALKLRGRGAMLDVGCGRGDLAAHFAQAGWNSYGLDNSPAAVAAAQEIGVDAREGTLASAPWAAASFDLIVMNHSLEHMPDPVEALETARRLLREDGALVVAVPNWQSLQRRAFGTYWAPLDVPRHLTHFSPQALRLAARQAGFTRVRTRNYATGVGLPLSLWFWLARSPLRGRRQQTLLLTAAVSYPITWLVGRTLGGDATYLVARP